MVYFKLNQRVTEMTDKKNLLFYMIDGQTIMTQFSLYPIIPRKDELVVVGGEDYKVTKVTFFPEETKTNIYISLTTN